MPRLKDFELPPVYYPIDVDLKLDDLAKAKQAHKFQQLVQRTVEPVWDRYHRFFEQRGLVELQAVCSDLKDMVKEIEGWRDFYESQGRDKEAADLYETWEEYNLFNSVAELIRRRYVLGISPGDFSTVFLNETRRGEDVEDRRRSDLLNNQLRVANLKIKQYKMRARGMTARRDMIALIDKHRHKSSGRANCAAIGRKLGRHRDTVDRWIRQLGLQDYAKLPSMT